MEATKEEASSGIGVAHTKAVKGTRAIRIGGQMRLHSLNESISTIRTKQ